MKGSLDSLIHKSESITASSPTPNSKFSQGDWEGPHLSSPRICCFVSWLKLRISALQVVFVFFLTVSDLWSLSPRSPFKLESYIPVFMQQQPVLFTLHHESWQLQESTVCCFVLMIKASLSVHGEIYIDTMHTAWLCKLAVKRFRCLNALFKIIFLTVLLICFKAIFLEFLYFLAFTDFFSSLINLFISSNKC